MIAPAPADMTSMFEEEDEAPVRVPLAPLIDIVFLLIGFFMLAAQIGRDERDLQVELPSVAHVRPGGEAPGEVIINVRASGEITIGGDLVPMSNLADVLASRLREGLDAGTRPDVVIRADRAQTYATLDDVLEACESVGVDDVVLRARPPGGSR